MSNGAGGLRSRLDVLPIRNAVQFPLQTATYIVTRERSLRALRRTHSSSRLVLVLTQKSSDGDGSSAQELHRIGTICEVMQLMHLPDGSARVIVRGLARAQVERFHQVGGILSAQFTSLDEDEEMGDSLPWMREVQNLYQGLVEASSQLVVQPLDNLMEIESSGTLADAIAHNLSLSMAQKQGLLETLAGSERLKALAKILTQEQQIHSAQDKVRKKIESDLGDVQREYYLREQLKVIQTELGGGVGSAEGIALKDRAQNTDLPLAVRARVEDEIAKLNTMQVGAPEYAGTHQYISCLLELPWKIASAEILELNEIEATLSSQHAGLCQIKERLLDIVAIRNLKPDAQQPVLCFLGPPGVGKTSFARRFAESLGREMVTISLASVRDEAELKGHRRTYVNSMPGRLVKAFQQAGTNNPVILLDEVDKISLELANILIEVLDPIQNHAFSDHYLDIPFDLSNAMFILTANDISLLPSALRDRLEVVRFPSYSEQDKLCIVTNHLLPAQLESVGLNLDELEFTTNAVIELVREFTDEAGVREANRMLSLICRKLARIKASGQLMPHSIGIQEVHALLGAPTTTEPIRQPRVGVISALALTEFGGEVLTLECVMLSATGVTGKMEFTGNLGLVMRESASAALTCVRDLIGKLDTRNHFPCDIHLHAQLGSLPKEGPSAGLPIALTLLSTILNFPIPGDVAATGEITIHGRVLGVGGFRDKFLAAHRSGIKVLFAPVENESQFSSLPEKEREDIEIVWVSDVMDALTRLKNASEVGSKNVKIGC